MKYLIAIVVVLVGIAGWMYFHADSVAEMAIDQSEMSVVQMLQESTQAVAELCNDPRMKGALGMSSEECQQEIYSKEESCLAQAAETWPGKLQDMDELNAATEFYSKCLIPS